VATKFQFEVSHGGFCDRTRRTRHLPRPRPDAVHFSSSTASSISDYGFMLCDMFRRDLAMAVLRDEVSLEALRVQATDAVTTQILGLLGLDPSEADVVLAPSGSDTELLAVMSALAATDQPLTNILIAPEETGRAVALAGAGRFFDDIAGSGAAVRKGEEAWPGRSIEVKQVAIRSPDGRPRVIAEIEAELSQIVRAALSEGPTDSPSRARVLENRAQSAPSELRDGDRGYGARRDRCRG